LAQPDRSASVGVTIRFAAEQYNAFEASMRTNNLAEDKEKQFQDFVNAFTDMLQMNLRTTLWLSPKNKRP
jgi:hypothetical protein